jgi:GAF domain-containing protein
VPDVQAFPGHIACDGSTRSELVIPILRSGQVLAVLDLDCPHLAGFSLSEARLLEALLGRIFSRVES